MLILIVFGIFLEMLKCVECHVIFKCCPNDTKLSVDIYEDNNLAPSKIFSCVPNDKSVNETLQFVGNNIVEDGAVHIPECSDLNERTNDILDTSLVFYGNSCVDVLDNQYHVLSCDESTVQDNGTKIFKTRKCCPRNFAYDLFEQKCVDKSHDPNVNNFTSLLDTQSNVFEVEMPNCKENEVEVEYQSSVHKIIYVNVTNTIIVILPPGDHVNLLDENSYCLEKTLSTDVATGDGKISDEYYKENVLNSRKSSKLIVKSCEGRDICDDIPCIRKCCKNGERFVFSGDEDLPKCEPHTKRLIPKLHFFNKTVGGTIFQPVEPPEFGIIQEQKCEKYKLEPEDEHYFNTIDGTLLLVKENVVFDQNQYCVDYYLNLLDAPKDITEDDYKLTTFVCFPADFEAEFKYTLYAIAVSISAFFLGLTISVYMTFPKLLNLHGKTLLCYVISLFFAYTGLAIIQFNSILEVNFCKFLAFFIYFFFLAAFSWLNVLCFDIWLCFGSIRARGIGKKRDLKRFILYSIYAWGIPSALTLLTFCVDQFELISPEWRPNLGTVGCWFVVNNTPGHLLFFQLPVFIQLCTNLVLYVLTVIHCNKVKSEIHRMQVNDSRELTKKRFIADKAKFIMNTKLFIVMGVLWLLEILPSIYHDMPIYYSYVVDIFNLLQGVLVFLIFVFKRKVLVSFQKKLGMKTRNAKMSGPTSSNTTTTSTNINSTALENSMQNGKNKPRSDSNISTINMTNLKR